MAKTNFLKMWDPMKQIRNDAESPNFGLAPNSPGLM